jgi:hypothetical protein
MASVAVSAALVLLCAIMALALRPSVAYADDGEPDLVINTADELMVFAATINDYLQPASVRDMHVVLGADIDMTGKLWMPIGENTVFTGIFDGRGHTISNLDFNNPRSTSYSGLFGLVGGANADDTAVIKNVVLKGSTSTAVYNYVAGIVAYVYGPGTVEISNVANEMNITATGSPRGIGGIVGNVNSRCNLIIRDSYNAGTLIDTTAWGNQVSSVAGILSASNNLPADDGTRSITNCYNVGDISGTGLVGGIFSPGEYNAAITISNCYNTGAISTQRATDPVNSIGAISSNNTAAQVFSNNYYLNQAGLNSTGQVGVSGIVTLPDTTNNLSKTEAEMKASTFPASLDPLRFVEGNGYPALTWQSAGPLGALGVPIITQTPVGGWVDQGGTAPVLSVSATLPASGKPAGSGTISRIEWFQNSTASTSGGTSVGTPSSPNTTTATDSYTPSTATVGLFYYYAVITNSWTDGGAKTCSQTTTPVLVRVTDPARTPTSPTFTAQPQDAT